MPPIAPIRTAIHTFADTPTDVIVKYAATIKSIAEPIVPYLKAISGLLFENILTVRIPRIEQIRPTEARTKGIPIKALTSPPSKETEEADIVVAKIIDAIIT